MTIQEIKNAVKKGHKVHWINELCTVVHSETGQWIINCPTGTSTYLLWDGGKALYGLEEDFYSPSIGPDPKCFGKYWVPGKYVGNSLKKSLSYPKDRTVYHKVGNRWEKL